VFAQIDGATGGGLAAANGGFGATVALTPNGANPALGAADEETVAGADARGVPRVATGADIGAFEAPGTETPSHTVTTSLDVVDDSDELTSLREAVGHANSGALAGTITFALAASEAFDGGGTAALSMGALVTTIDGDIDVAIDGDIGGDGTADVTQDVGGSSRVMNVAGGSFDLSGLIITGGAAETVGHGAGIVVTAGGALALDTVRSQDNAAGVAGDFSSFGGGVAILDGSSLVARDAAFTGNAASCGGGGLYVSDSAVSLVNAAFSGNAASDEYGGAIWAESGTLDLVNATVHGNAAGYRGGGVFSSATTSIDHPTIMANEGRPIKAAASWRILARRASPTRSSWATRGLIRSAMTFWSARSRPRRSKRSCWAKRLISLSLRLRSSPSPTRG
jgi:hypothetical protein